MKIKLLATLIVASVFATGCSQQSAGGSQVASGASQAASGASQTASSQQVAGGSQVASQSAGSQQVAGGSQVASQSAGGSQVGSQQQVEAAAPVVVAAAETAGRIAMPAKKPVMVKKAPMVKAPVKQYGHVHPANRCTKSVRHNHPGSGRAHNHKYSCGPKAPAKKRWVAPKKPMMQKRRNPWAHSHPANRCTKSVQHIHKYNAARHTHGYSCDPKRTMMVKPAAKPPVDVRALQQKLKAKGYYKGPIDGIVGPGTRSALKRFMNR